MWRGSYPQIERECGKVLGKARDFERKTYLVSVDKQFFLLKTKKWF